MLPFLKIMLRNLLQGPSTEAFPFAPAEGHKNIRGAAAFDPEKCILCGICRHVCAPGAIQIRVDEEGTGMRFVLWHNSCVFCGMCAHYCPTGALRMTDDWHLAHAAEERFHNCLDAFIPFGQCSQCGAKIQPRPQAIVERLGARNPAGFMLCPSCKRLSIANTVAKIHHIAPQEAP